MNTPTTALSRDLRTLRGRIVQVANLINLIAREEREAERSPLTWQPFATLQVTATTHKP